LRKYLLFIIVAYLIAQVLLNWDFGDAVKGPYPAKGRASWYHASITASGERLDNDSLTCALRKKDYGKYYKVCSIDNGKCVVVRHNNFGPIKRLFRQGRIIDLSRKAFSELANLESGIINVTITEVESQ
jgi:rare lipoprotein A